MQHSLSYYFINLICETRMNKKCIVCIFHLVENVKVQIKPYTFVFSNFGGTIVV